MENILAAFLSTNQFYLLYLIGVMICVGIIKEYNLFNGVYIWLNKHVKNRKLLVAIISCISGVLPVPGRCVVSAAMLDTVATKDKKRRQMFGILDYLCTHHYYFWSPLEKTVIIPMAALGLSYTGFLSLIWPLLLCYLAFVAYYIMFHVKEDDVELNIQDSQKSTKMPVILPLIGGIGAMCFSIPAWIIFPLLTLYYALITKCSPKKWIRYINWKLVGMVFLLLGGTTLIKDSVAPLVEGLESATGVMLSLLPITFGLAFLMGSSSKFAGIVAVMCSLFGVQYLPLFFAVEFIGYLLSPFHKCVCISKMYFSTNLWMFYKPLFVLSAILLFASLIVFI